MIYLTIITKNNFYNLYLFKIRIQYKTKFI